MENNTSNSAPNLHVMISDRVKRKSQKGSLGTVTDLIVETNTSVTDKQKEPKYIIKVEWDNGTTSYCGPEALEGVSSS
jgi:hypothetical protein